MESVSIGYFVIVLFGLMLGSFAGASVWRLRARQLVVEEKEFAELKQTPVAQLSEDMVAYRQELEDTSKDRKRDLKRLRPIIQPMATDRSQCLHCHHELAWYDLIPLVSWLSTKGKCRYCRKPIGRFEPIIEVSMAAVFAAVLTYGLYSGADWWWLLVGLVVAVMLIILFVYDLKWFILPDVVMWPFIGLAGITAVVNVSRSDDPVQTLGGVVGSVLILGGLYLALWLASKGRWVGFGDVKLGLGLGLLLADWQLAFLALFLANLFGTLIVLPGLLSGKLSRQTHVPFGPLLIAGFAAALFVGPGLIEAFTYISIRFSDTLLML